MNAENTQLDHISREAGAQKLTTKVTEVWNVQVTFGSVDVPLTWPEIAMKSGLLGQTFNITASGLTFRLGISIIALNS